MRLKLPLLLSVSMLSSMWNFAKAGESRIPPNRFDVDIASWMSGKWSSITPHGMQTDAFFSDAEGGVILGQMKMIVPPAKRRKSKLLYYEFIKIQRSKGLLALQIFPKDRKPFELQLTFASTKKLVFENKENDFPQKVVYEKIDETHFIEKTFGEFGGEKSLFENIFTKSDLASKDFVRPVRASLSVASWLAGQWNSTSPNGLEGDAFYSSTQGDIILGQVKILKNPREKGKAETIFDEFLTIKKDRGFLTLEVFPRGQKPTKFKIVKASSLKIVFENLKHDFPKRITYERVEPNKFKETTYGTFNGQEVTFEHLYVSPN